ncbi:MAG: tetratricopeptide repeat protein [Phycisphaeraceae bacterium]|nr:tetratricopeptide repeat protein [Phycisphaeraceae bacterium]
MTKYTLAWALEQAGAETDEVESTLTAAREAAPDHCFLSRLQEQLVLEWALARHPDDRNAAYGLGNYCYDRKRHEDAIRYWEQARDADPDHASTHRNLGIAYWNQQRDGEAARASYEAALACDSTDARIIAEFDQLREKLGDPAEDRLDFLQQHPEAVTERDDATVSLITLLNTTGKPDAALARLEVRRFHPWEGGEGKVLRQYTRARLKLGRAALEADDAETALEHFNRALDTPDNLGEKYHPLQAKADVLYWQGRALAALGRQDEAQDRFEAAAAEAGDFQNMAVAAYSPISYWRGLALARLGRENEARELFTAMADYARQQAAQPAKIDYFATSLPNLLVFEEDLEAAHAAQFSELEELAERGLTEIQSPAENP